LPDSEEYTRIKSVTYLKFSWLKTLLVIPLLSVLTIFILPLVLYWSVTCRAWWVYTRVTSVKEATHVLISAGSNSFSIETICDQGKLLASKVTDGLPQRFAHYKNGEFKVSLLMTVVFCLPLPEI
jgi:hypothetical protein